ncbi:hypothetical protein [Microbacterium sp. ABRD28]|uniref:hypothetical protein n=1 Tax=Microbacterium sp. ABRD28 TaxID=2268461 RepID=UPI000F555BD1|nr:hypothetical protein [Microbacterium sp. ABRD28]AZC13468.1 hypothetical protein DT073_06920 [Microbacterium sp. ABRD28]
MPNLLRRLLGFSTLPFLGAVLPLVALPIVARIGGVDGWSALNVGQAVGAYAAAVGFVGWNVLGTAMVAVERDADERRHLYARSFYSRAFVVSVLTVPTALVSALLAPDGTRAVAVLFATAGALGGLGISWYGVGISSISTIVLYDLIPRAIATAVAIALVLWTGEILWYGAALLVAACASPLAFHMSSFGRLFPQWVGAQTVREDIFAFRSAWGVEVVGNLYANAPVPVSAATAGARDVATFSSADRLYRYGLMAIVAAGNALQGWVLEVAPSLRARRHLAAFLLMGGVGAVGVVVLGVLGQPLTALLFGSELIAESATLWWLAAAYFAVASSTPIIRNVLMPARQERAVLLITVVSAIAGLGAMILCGTLFGVAGVAAGLAVGESLTLILCAFVAVRSRALTPRMVHP